MRMTMCVIGGDARMPNQPASSTLTAATAGAEEQTTTSVVRHETLAHNEMPCPVCGSPMPDLKGGKATICPNCGFKDSCCF